MPKNYDPSQPRRPKGQDGAGQWFSPGDVVESGVTAQGMTKGEKYTVRGSRKSSVGMFGDVVTYELEDSGGRRLEVGNLHVLASKVGPARDYPVTQKGVFEKLRAVGMTARYDAETGEYRVNFPGGSEDTAYYTSDPHDAVLTGMDMIRREQVAHGRVLSARDRARVAKGLGTRRPGDMGSAAERSFSTRRISGRSRTRRRSRRS